MAIMSMNKFYFNFKKKLTNYNIKRDLLWKRKFLLTLHKLNKLGLQSQIMAMLMGMNLKTSTKNNLKGNIYLGKISRIEPSLQAAFVDFGNERHGFLAFNDIQSEYYQLPKSDKDALKQEEEEIREELNKVTENIDEIENQESHETTIQFRFRRSKY